jgi:hypothetical protein
MLARMADSAGPPRGLDRMERGLFVFGVLAFAFLMLVFGQPLAPDLYLPLVVAWITGGLLFIWWFDRHLARADQGKIARIQSRRRRGRR